MDNLVNLFYAAVLAGAPLLYGTLGEILTEKSGNLNMGVEGMMYMGAIGGLSTIYFYEMYCGAMANQLLCLVLAVAGSFLCGALGALIFSFLTITLRANQNVTGLTLTIFGTGFGNFFGEIIGSRSASNYMTISTEAKAAFANHNLLPFLANSDSAFLQ
ncbi:MAG: ABC transporter permease, partial [Firmicutes bacterium]|nr:ABC transporter permease [Bacillota bacterium]